MVFQAEDRTKAKRQQAELAIRAALEGRWADAAQLNQTIVEAFPTDVDALNRFGKALTELGKYDEARGAYMKSLELDSLNSIARKNLSRLETMGKKPRSKKKVAVQKISPQMFIEETGKTTTTDLVRPVKKVAAGLTAGDLVSLRRDKKRGLLLVDDPNGEQIGEVEPKLAQRLLKLMEGGNQYIAAISNLSDDGVRVFIRETFQDPSQVGKVSFPGSVVDAGEPVRPYTKRALIQDDQPLYRGDEDGD
ncbi:MAG: tetratricopeptide repeat protein, partial [Dehalococcoidia bacterium]